MQQGDRLATTETTVRRKPNCARRTGATPRAPHHRHHLGNRPGSSPPPAPLALREQLRRASSGIHPQCSSDSPNSGRSQVPENVRTRRASIRPPRSPHCGTTALPAIPTALPPHMWRDSLATRESRPLVLRENRPSCRKRAVSTASPRTLPRPPNRYRASRFSPREPNRTALTLPAARSPTSSEPEPSRDAADSSPTRTRRSRPRVVRPAESGTPAADQQLATDPATSRVHPSLSDLFTFPSTTHRLPCIDSGGS